MCEGRQRFCGSFDSLRFALLSEQVGCPQNCFCFIFREGIYVLFRSHALRAKIRTPYACACTCRQVNHLETQDSFVEHAHAAGLELLESLDKTTSMATHFQTLIEVSYNVYVVQIWWAGLAVCFGSVPTVSPAKQR